MATLLVRMKRHRLLGILLATVCLTNMGCLQESTFTLASDSRLPKWVTLRPGLTRANVSLTMSYYSRPWGSSTKFILQDKNGQTLKEEDGKVRCKEPFQLKTGPHGSSSDYPTYEAISVNGVTEIVEHRKMEPIFYVSDDSAVWKQYESIGCG
jgi:hypothetical protein